MDSRTIKAMTSSKNEHWNTPKDIIVSVRKINGSIGLDPCSNSTSIVMANTEWNGVNRDGLKESWQNYGLVFVNPPYGTKLKKWVAKAVDEARYASATGSDTEIVLLAPARVDTQVFQEFIFPTANQILLIKGRLTFSNAPFPALFPSLLAYWGPNASAFETVFLTQGVLLRHTINAGRV